MAEPSDWDVLFVACTRPTMKMGVPVEALVINALIQAFAYLWIGHGRIFWMLGSLIIFPMLHIPMRILTSIDHNIFREIRLWSETRGIQLKIREWGGPLLRVLPHGVPPQARDLASSV